MFDIGFSELIVIAIVALVVIGPERLPKVARTAGLLLGRLQRYVNDVKSDISREMQLDELKKIQADIQDSARSFEHSISSGIQSVEQTVEQTAQSVESSVEGLVPEALAGANEPVPASAVSAELPGQAPAVHVESVVPSDTAGTTGKV
ncbi:MAG: Sec-independent protein translocase protein TatB [Betaproteobacteria bacterium]